MSDIAIGIDLGTTNSCTAYYRNGSVQVVVNAEGGRTTPSYVYYLKKSTQPPVVGSHAKHMSEADPPNGIYEIKRFMGKRYSEVQKQLDYFSFKVEGDNDDKPVISIARDNKTDKVTPEDVSALILKKLKADVTKKLKSDVTKAVITVPAYFNTTQREATLLAAKKAGFEVLQLFNEPTASALSYHHNNKEKKDGYSLVYDLGGGTFDVSILKKSFNRVDVVGVDGDSNLGGKDFDNCIIDYVCDELIKKFNYNPKTDHRRIRRIQNFCEDAKKILSSVDETTVNLIGIVPNESSVQIPLTREKFEKLIQKLLDRTVQIILRCIKRSNISKEDINDVVLAGGSCRIPRVHEMLSKIFSEEKLDFTLNFDESIAEGAAIQAALLNNSPQQAIQEKLRMTDVVALSLGVQCQPEIMCKIIQRNTPIPAEKTISFHNSEDLQTSVIFRVFEGERLDIRKNFYLGTLTLENLTPLPPGKCQYSLKMSVDINGILSITAFENSQDNNIKQLKINYNRKTDGEILDSLTNAEENEEEDRMYLEFAERKLHLSGYCEAVKYNLRILNLKDKLKHISDFCDETKRQLNALQIEDVATLQNLIRTAEKKCDPLVKVYKFKSMPSK